LIANGTLPVERRAIPHKVAQRERGHCCLEMVS
jgi:hypothetical protein